MKNKGIKMSVNCKNVDKVVRKVKKLEKAFIKLNESVETANETLTALKELLPLEIEFSQEGV